MSAEGWVLIIGAIFYGIDRVVAMFLAYHREKDRLIREAAVADKVEEVRVRTVASDKKVDKVAATLVESKASTDEKLDSIHDLCNSAMAEQKRMVAVSTRETANATRDPAHIAIAEAAEIAYERHIASQIR
jgi:dihydroxyacetone kinase